MNLEIEIHNVKSIKQLNLSLPLEKGLYAITGENSSGKSTFVSCASTVFFNAPMIEYFGQPSDDSKISFKIGNASRLWFSNNGKWWRQSSGDKMEITGFYEGSIIFGTRFKDTVFSAISKLDNVNENNLENADIFIKENLGLILHNDCNYYENLFLLKKDVASFFKLRGQPFFYKTSNGKLISQARMSTGENLLVSILFSLYIIKQKLNKRGSSRKKEIIFLDEIELALHSSSLRRLVDFLLEFSNSYDLSIFFSTHSLELIRGIKPENIYYLERLVDDTLNVINPCYPAFATRSLYNDDGYGNDFVIFVEDDIAKNIVDRIIREQKLIHNFRLKIIPTGGWTNTLVFAREVISSKLLLKNTKILTILDRDIKNEVPGFQKTHPECRNLTLNYLPINSLEKFLRNSLFKSVDAQLIQVFDNYLFQGRPLNNVLKEYSKLGESADDNDGKILYSMLINELKSIKKTREDLVEMVIKYLFDNRQNDVKEIESFLKSELV